MSSSLTLGISDRDSDARTIDQPVDFAIINNRKRAIIALVHSVFFLGVAAVQLASSHAAPYSLRGEKAVAGSILLGIYVIVTTVLLILLRYSRSTKERLYFAFCAASAAFGLVRILLGDPVLHANILRVLLLSCAVVIGTGILRMHSTTPVPSEVGEP
jgi:protein-S-isoprenylcysteine O-methyltransferase Ste14